MLWAMIATLQTAAQSLSARMDIVLEERDRIVVASRLEVDKMKHQLRQERKHSANMMFILHSQRGTIKYLHDVVKMYSQRAAADANARKQERTIFRKEIWEQIFAFTRLSTDVNELFVFFASRLANLAGARSPSITIWLRTALRRSWQPCATVRGPLCASLLLVLWVVWDGMVTLRLVSYFGTV